MNYYEKLAEKMWVAIYPDRRPWEKLEEGTRQEWARFAKCAFEVIQDDINEQHNEYLKSSEKFFPFRPHT